jgi:hypothetical protein
VIYRVVLSATLSEVARRRSIPPYLTIAVVPVANLVKSLESHSCAVVRRKSPGMIFLRKKWEGWVGYSHFGTRRRVASGSKLSVAGGHSVGENWARAS